MSEIDLLISIVVPVYNVEGYLEFCIKSILSQSYKQIELILVDDGSPDKCPSICDDWAYRDSRIKVIHKKNGGLSSARNSGIEIARGDYIAFIDSDDYVDSEFITKMVNAIINTKSDIVCCGYYEVINSKNKIPDKKLIPGEFTGEIALKQLLDCTIQDYAWNKLYKMSLFSEIRYPDDRNFEDMATIYKTFLRARKVTVINERLYYYLIREGSISNTLNINRYLSDMFDTILTYIERIDEISIVYSIFRIQTIDQMMDRIDYFLNLPGDKTSYNLNDIARFVKPYYKEYLISKKTSLKRKLKMLMMHYMPIIYVKIKKCKQK